MYFSKTFKSIPPEMHGHAGIVRKARFILRCVLGFLLLCVVWAAPVSSQTAVQGVGQGFVEGVQFEAPSQAVAGLHAGRQMRVSGWGGIYVQNSFITSVGVWLGDRQVYQGRLGMMLRRDDVAQATGQSAWLHSGFDISMRLPDTLPAGPQTLKVVLHTGDGNALVLGMPADLAQVQVPESARGPSPSALALLVVALGLPVLMLAWLHLKPAAQPASRHGARCFAVAVLASFGCLVAGGWSGSSLPLLLQGTPFIAHDARPFLGQPQAVRSDEWLVVTPLAISQTSHEPRFPAVNTNHGIDGQNMNVTGMTGAPVANLAALARPANWGFFVFDLRRALAWSWWLPFFGCFAALAALLSRWFRLDWRLASGLALSVAASPYSVSFSGWPALTVMFAALGMVAFDKALHGGKTLAVLAWAALAGWSAAGFALVLYPSWQISLAYLLLPLGLVWLWQQRGAWWGPRSQGHAGLGLNVSSVGVALVVLALLVGAWWLDAADAVQRVRDTVYPGGRLFELGGQMDPWFLSKGLLGHITMFNASNWMIPSDAGSFVFVCLPLVVALVWRSLTVGHSDTMPSALALPWLMVGYGAFALYFLWHGIGPWLAQTLKWGTVHPIRMDLALGLAQTLLIAWLAGQYARANALDRLPCETTGVPASGRLKALAAVTALVSVWLFYQDWLRIPPAILDWFTPGFMLLIACGVAFASVLLVLQKYAAFITLYAAWTVSMALLFNPLGQATNSLGITDELAQALQAAQPAQSLASRRVVVLEKHTWALGLAAAGVPVLNTTFYDPQTSLWKALDPVGEYASVVNRYQHLDFFVSHNLDEGQTFRITSPSLDLVQVLFNPQAFDFGVLEAGAVLAAPDAATQLAGNASLALVHATPDWVLLRIVR